MDGNPKHNYDEERERITFDHLPPETQHWLRDLRPIDLATLNDAIRFQEKARTIGNFGKWLLLSLAGLIMFFAAFGDAIVRIMGWFSNKGSH